MKSSWTKRRDFIGWYICTYAISAGYKNGSNLTEGIIMHQSFETPAPPPPPIWAEPGIHFLCKWKWVKSPVPGDKSEWCIPLPLLFNTNGTPLVKQLITDKSSTLVNWNTVGSHEINRLIFERPANNSQKLLNAQWVSQNIFIVEVLLSILLNKLTWKGMRRPWLQAHSPPTGEPIWSVYELKVPAIPR